VSAYRHVGVAISLVMRNFYQPQEAWKNVSAYRRVGVVISLVMRNFYKPQEA